MPYTYAFVGLTPSERSLLESIFALDAAEGEDLAQVRRPEEADLLIVNGDDRAVVLTLRADNPAALMVVVGRPSGGELADLPVLRRPLDMTGVVRVLSGLDWPEEGRRSQPSEFPGTFSPSSAPATQVPDTGPVSMRAADSRLEHARMGLARTMDSQAYSPASLQDPTLHPSAFAPTTASIPVDAPSSAHPASSVLTLNPQPVSARATWDLPEQRGTAAGIDLALHDTQFPGLPNEADADIMVVVGPHATKRHTLSLGLRRLGYRVRVVEGAELAEQLLRERRVPFVFMDQASLGPQLLPLARALNALRPSPAEPPKLIVVARHNHFFDRMRARMVGCTWMVAPINRARLVGFLARRGLQPGV